MKVNNIKIANNLAAKNAPDAASRMNFKGFGTTLGNLNKNLMSRIEHGGFFAEFVLLDMTALVLPRVYQGFQRNKEELGHLNYQAGTEEFLREFITGPSLFLIPIAAVLLAGKALGKTTQINSSVMKKFTEAFKNIGANIKGLNLLENQKNFANKLFNNLFDSNPSRITSAKIPDAFTLQKYKESFTNILTDSLNKKGKDLKQAKALFTDLISDINTTHFNSKNTFGVDIILDGKKMHTSSAGDLFDDIRKYMQDVIPSTKASIAENTSAEEVNTIIDKLTKIRENGRKLLTLVGTVSLAGFLSIIPKIYQRSKTNPALDGLQNKETKGAK